MRFEAITCTMLLVFVSFKVVPVSFQIRGDERARSQRKALVSDMQALLAADDALLSRLNLILRVNA